jgi:cysteine desulfurase
MPSPEHSSKSHPIYLDYHSTRSQSGRINTALHDYSIRRRQQHQPYLGDEAEKAVSQAATHIAKLVGASPKELIFTSGATESINLVIQGFVGAWQCHALKMPRIAVSPVEHKAVLDTCQALTKKGLAEIISLQVDSKGRLDLNHLEQVCKSGI